MSKELFVKHTIKFLFSIIPVFGNAINEFVAFADAVILEHRLKEIEDIMISIKSEDELKRALQNLGERKYYEVRKNFKYAALDASPEILKTFVSVMVEAITCEDSTFSEDVCELLRQFNKHDIVLLNDVKKYIGTDIYVNDRNNYISQNSNNNGQIALGNMKMENRVMIYANTIKLTDFYNFINIKSIKVTESLNSGANLNLDLDKKEIIAMRYRSILKMQQLGIFQVEICNSLGMISLNNIESFHVTLFGETIIKYI